MDLRSKSVNDNNKKVLKKNKLLSWVQDQNISRRFNYFQTSQLQMSGGHNLQSESIPAPKFNELSVWVAFAHSTASSFFLSSTVYQQFYYTYSSAAFSIYFFLSVLCPLSFLCPPFFPAVLEGSLDISSLLLLTCFRPPAFSIHQPLCCVGLLPFVDHSESRVDGKAPSYWCLSMGQHKDYLSYLL